MQESSNDWGIVGNSWAVDLLKRQAIRARRGEAGLHHAFLFCGPVGIGRRTLALRFMQALNCFEQPSEGVPCLKCTACKAIEEEKHVDLSIVQAEQEGGVIRIEQIRDLLNSLSLSPYMAPYRMVLILRFERANLHAANALLKSLEEPPPHVLFFLTASREEDVLPTIASRCQTFTLKPAATHVLKQHLKEQMGLAEERAELIAHLSGGRFGVACRLDQDPEALQLRDGWLNELVRLAGASLPQRFRFAEKMADFRYKSPDAVAAMKKNLREMLQVWLSFWRDVMVQTSFHYSDALVNIDRVSVIKQISDQVDEALAWTILRNTEMLFERWDRNVNIRLAFENYLLELPYLRVHSL